MGAESAVAVLMRRCECGKCRVGNACILFSSSSLPRWSFLFGHFPFFAHRIRHLLRRGLLPVGLNSLQFGLSWSPTPVPGFVVAVDGDMIHFLRRVGGTRCAFDFSLKGKKRERGREEEREEEREDFLFVIVVCSCCFVAVVESNSEISTFER